MSSSNPDDSLIVGAEPAIRTPVKQSDKVECDKIAFTEYKVEGQPDKVLLQGVYYLPLTFQQVKEKMVIPEARKKQHDEFAKRAEIIFNKKVKYIRKKVK